MLSLMFCLPAMIYTALISECFVIISEFLITAAITNLIAILIVFSPFPISYDPAVKRLCPVIIQYVPTDSEIPTVPLKHKANTA